MSINLRTNGSKLRKRRLILKNDPTPKNQKAEFSDRLNHALDLNHIPPKGKGRQVTLAKMFGVSQKGASKWLEGETYPDLQRIAVIAKKLNVNVEWLAYGTGVINIESIPGSGKSGWKRVPVVSWNEAGEFEKYKPSLDADWVWTDVETGSRSYALRVCDDSMEPRYEQGAIVIVDPDRVPVHRNIVIIKWRQSNTTTCAQLLIDGPNRYLKPHNPNYNTILIDETTPQIKFCGTARQIFMKY